ncbi:hypothetical protein Tco_1180677 [Tanacetum coccineum]
MTNLSEDVQCAGSDTRPPMLDRTDFALWQQRPFLMGTFRETLTEESEGALNLGPERPRVYSDLSPKDKERYNDDIRAMNILLQGLPKDVTPSNLSMQRNIEYPKALLYGSIAQDIRTTLSVTFKRYI